VGCDRRDKDDGCGANAVSRCPSATSWRRWLPLGLVLVVAAGGCGSTPKAVLAPRPNQKPHPSAAANYTCLTDRAKSIAVGDPDISFVPSIQSVQLVPILGGLIVQYKFRSSFEGPPAGVYFAWTVHIYRDRSDANQSTQSIELQVQDRGAGWEPTGWTILASSYYNSSPIEGNVHTDKAHDELSAFFPAGFANLSPPFYWFANQEAYRGYLPEKSRTAPDNFEIYGSINTDCPFGVRHDPNSLPYAKKLLMAPS